LHAGLFCALLRLSRGSIPKIRAREREAKEQGAASRAERAPSLLRGEENHAFGLNELMENGIAY